MNDSTTSLSLDVASARARILGQVETIRECEQVSIHAALDRILAADIATSHDMPPYTNAAMDGYALAFDSLADKGETTLHVAGAAYAGHPFADAVAAGEAIRIMTGAAMPAGADTVVMQETVRREGDHVVIAEGTWRGQHVRLKGEEMLAGDTALPAGRRCGPADLGVIASLGIDNVTVYRRLRVAYFSSGDELVSPGAPLSPGHIYDANRYTLFGALARLGCETIDLGMVRDDPDTLRDILLGAADNVDAIVTSGGVSTGDADVVRLLLEHLGQAEFWRLNMKPGRPMAFGRIGKAWIYGLPGNPVATLVAFYQIVRDALLKQAGLSPLPEMRLLTARSARKIGKSAGRREFVRGYYSVADDGALRVEPAGAQGSGMLRSLTTANCFIVLPEERGQVSPEDEVLIQPFDSLV